MTDDPYVYPGTSILRNKLGITDGVELERVERLLVRQRATEGTPSGDFNLSHLQAIHRHLFQDLYDWAGEIRILEIAKGGDQFMFRQYIANGMADVHGRIVAAKYFRGTSLADFAEQAGQIMGDVNYVHPFREGNGRTQLLYLKQLSLSAGHSLDLTRIEPVAWIEASQRANKTDYAPMATVIRSALEGSVASRKASRDKGNDRGGGRGR